MNRCRLRFQIQNTPSRRTNLRPWPISNFKCILFIPLPYTPLQFYTSTSSPRQYGSLTVKHLSAGRALSQPVHPSLPVSSATNVEEGQEAKPVHRLRRRPARKLCERTRWPVPRATYHFAKRYEHDPTRRHQPARAHRRLFRRHGCCSRAEYQQSLPIRALNACWQVVSRIRSRNQPDQGSQRGQHHCHRRKSIAKHEIRMLTWHRETTRRSCNN